MSIMVVISVVSGVTVEVLRSSYVIIVVELASVDTGVTVNTLSDVTGADVVDVEESLM